MNFQNFKLTKSPCRKSRPFTVIVEGNIGCGKTTFLNYFEQFNDVVALAEPVNKWRDCNGFNLLDKMYEDPAKWSFSFQSYVQLTMLEHHTFRTSKPVKLLERSLFSARNCFVEQMCRDGFIERTAVSVIDEWFKWAQENCDITVDLIVYLRTCPEVAYERTIKRNRPEEKSLSLDYIKQLHEIHENWLYHKTMFHLPAPVMVIDANLDKNVIEKEYKKCQTQIFTDIKERLPTVI